MDNIIYMGYDLTLNDLDELKLTDDEQNALDMLVENENLMDINATPLVQNSPIRAFQVEQCDSIFHQLRYMLNFTLKTRQISY